MLGVLFCVLYAFLCARRHVPVSSEQPVGVDQEQVFEEEEPQCLSKEGKWPSPSIGDGHKGPLITKEKSIFSQIIKTQTNSQVVNYTPRNHSLVTGAHGPSNLSGPSNGRPQHPSGETPLHSRGPAPYHRNSTSLEGWTPPQAKLRLARGLDAPSGETPPRSRAGRPLGRDSASLEGYMRRRAGLRLARGSRGSAAPAPAPRPEH
jgi:hypothetical protein